MDTSAEFQRLVAAHRRLMLKYGNNSGWNPTSKAYSPSVADDSPTGHPRFEGAPWIDPSFALQRSMTYPTPEGIETLSCPRCHFSMGSKPFEPLPHARGSTEGNKASFPSLPTEGTMGINHMISLQLASMGYAKLLAALNVGNGALPPYNREQTLAAHPYSLEPCPGSFAVSGAKSLNKRKEHGSEQEARQTIPVKRTRLVWTKDLHQRFVDAIETIGIKKAVPKAILEVMNVEGLTRENVASHLQKYRLQLGQHLATRRRVNNTTEMEATNAARSATTHASNDFAESDSTASMTNNTGDSSTTAIPEQK